MSEIASQLIGKALVYLLRPIGLFRVACRNIARRVLLATNDEWLLVRYRKALRYKIIRWKIKPFHITDDILWWTDAFTVKFQIPTEVSHDEARLICRAQTIDPKFAEDLFLLTGKTMSMTEYIKEELEAIQRIAGE